PRAADARRAPSSRLCLPPAGGAPAAALAGIRRPPALAFGSESILLVEDDVAVRGTAARMLRDFGYRVVEAGDGQAALNLLGEGLAGDLLCTDLVMPRSINGWQLALDVWQQWPRQRVLVCTGYTDNPVVQQISQDLRIQLLHKPFGRKDLAAAVRQSLDDRASADAAMTQQARDSEPA